MRIIDDNIKKIVKALEEIGYSVGVETVFRDWCECSALAIANGCDLLHGEVWERREKRYLDIIGKYKANAGRFAEMLAYLTDAFNADPFHDYLGRVYMECFGGNKNLGQCFTPEGVCEVCAHTAIDSIPKNGEYKTLYEPACGGGAMTIAALGVLHRAGYNYQRYLRITTEDLDSLCVHMCYVQLSLLGARAFVYHKDTITQKTYDLFVTPGEALWPAFMFGRGDEPEPPAQDDMAAAIAEFPWLA